MVVECSRFCIMFKEVNVQISLQAYLIIMTYMTKNNHVEAYVYLCLFIHKYIKSNDEYGSSHPSKILPSINNVAVFLFLKNVYSHLYCESRQRCGNLTTFQPKTKKIIIYKLCFKKWFFQIMGLVHFDHLSINNLANF